MEKKNIPMPKTLKELINSDPKQQISYKQTAKSALKENDNLNLDQHDKYLPDFTHFAENLFDPEENIFVERKKALDAER